MKDHRGAAVRNEMSGIVRGPVVQASSIDQIVFQGERPRYPVPSQLPPAPRSFTNRDRELAALERWLTEDTEDPLLVVVSGSAGVGKTTLALRWLHDIRERFPDGQLYADLGAFAHTGPLGPEEALEWFLLALGTAAENIPPDLRQRAALYRTLTADRAVAVLLDNAFSAAQVRPLLAVSARSVVVVTSRWRLAGLHMDGAQFIYADPMNVPDSVRLLNEFVGAERLSDQHTAAEELARLCGGLPIALSVVGARLSARPHRTLSREVGDLRQDRLAALSLEELSIGVVFDVSYNDLPAEQAWLYRICSLHPGATFGVEVAAAMAELPVGEVEDTLDALAQRNLLTEVDDRRFRYHDLLLVHARQHAERTDDEPTRDAAARRMVEWYLDTTVAADVILHPTRRRVGPRFRQPPDRSGMFRTHPEALRWLDSERRNIVHMVLAADERGWKQLVWEFCEAMWGYYLHARNYGSWLDIHGRGIPAATDCDNPVAEAQLRNQLGSALTNLRRYDEAVHEHNHALRLAEQTDDRFVEAAALGELAGAAQGKGDFEGALGYLHRAKEIREVIGTARALALCQRRIGEVLAELGRYPQAVKELRQAADTMATLDKGQQARALTSLGVTYVRWGRLDEAGAPLTTALTMSTELRSFHYRAVALTALGDLAERAGDLATARHRYAEARQIYVDSGDPRAADLAEHLATIPEQPAT